MRLSKFYLPTVKDISSDVVASSHQYSLKAGLVAQSSSGIYTWLPFGLMVLKKVEGIVREEMGSVGFSEILMPALQPSDLWKESGRCDSYGSELFRVYDRNGREMVLGPTHEEVVTDVVRKSLKSSKELPINLFQVQWKYRDEPRPKNGILRCREFLMMDAYSFDESHEKSMFTYGEVFKAYVRIFRKMGLSSLAVCADSGAIGGSTSHEFHILTQTGESTIYYDSRALECAKKPDYCVEKLEGVYAVADDAHRIIGNSISLDELQTTRGIEAGHIFYLGDRYSKPMNLKFINADGHSSTHVKMGCYGIGLSRLVAAAIEVFSSERGMTWPLSIAPFKVGIVSLFPQNEECLRVANFVHDKFSDDSLYDDTNDSPGTKLSRMDLFGLPWQVVIGNSFRKNGVLELKNRVNGTTEALSVDDVISRLSS
ncbi:MAG: proline--tRNA ligase [Aaplasma endosymbiont of Hyalomma asiaticum]